jgi:hypothetical protein
MRNVGIGGPVALQEQCLYQIPIPCYPRERDRRESLYEQETGLQDRCSQDRPSEAKAIQKMCVLTGATNPRWLEQAIGSEGYRRPALCTVTVPDSRVGAAIPQPVLPLLGMHGLDAHMGERLSLLYDRVVCLPRAAGSTATRPVSGS